MELEKQQQSYQSTAECGDYQYIDLRQCDEKEPSQCHSFWLQKKSGLFVILLLSILLFACYFYACMLSIHTLCAVSQLLFFVSFMHALSVFAKKKSHKTKKNKQKHIPKHLKVKTL